MRRKVLALQPKVNKQTNWEVHMWFRLTFGYLRSKHCLEKFKECNRSEWPQLQYYFVVAEGIWCPEGDYVETGNLSKNILKWYLKLAY